MADKTKLVGEGYESFVTPWNAGAGRQPAKSNG